jgi:hypothetical protein
MALREWLAIPSCLVWQRLLPSRRALRPGHPRGCALGGCYGNFADYGSCYWRETRVPDGYGGWVVEKICN